MVVKIPHFKIRLPPELKQRLEHAAKQSRLSLTAEIVARLERSFDSLESEMVATRIDELNRMAIELEALKAIANSGHVTDEYAEQIRGKITRLAFLSDAVRAQMHQLSGIPDSEVPTITASGRRKR